MLRAWWAEVVMPAEQEDSAGLPWPLALAWGISLITMGVLIVVKPAMLAYLVAGFFLLLGTFILLFAFVAAYHALRDRPRRIRVRAGR